MMGRTLKILRTLEWSERVEVNYGHGSSYFTSRCPICKNEIEETVIEISDDSSKGAEYREYDGTLIGYRSSKTLHKIHEDNCELKLAIEELNNETS